MRRRRSALVLVLSLMLMAAVSACTPPGPSVSPERVQPMIDLVNLPPELPAATDLVAIECLARKGYKIPYSSAVARRPTNNYFGISGLFQSRESALTLGYAETAGASDPIAVYRDGLSEPEEDQFTAAFYGDPADGFVTIDIGGVSAVENVTGCRAESWMAVFGSLEDAVLINNFESTLSMASSDLGQGQLRVVKQTLPTYISCMKQAGIELPAETYGAGQYASEKFGTYRSDGDRPSAEEQQLAGTDYDCQEKSQVRAKLLEMFATQGGAWVIAHEGEVQALQTKVRESVVRANAIIKG